MAGPLLSEFLGRHIGAGEKYPVKIADALESTGESKVSDAVLCIYKQIFGAVNTIEIDVLPDIDAHCFSKYS